MVVVEDHPVTRMGVVALLGQDERIEVVGHLDPAGAKSEAPADPVADEAAKEKLRQEALKQVQDVLTQEEGKPIVEDLLFNNLIIQ